MCAMHWPHMTDRPASRHSTPTRTHRMHGTRYLPAVDERDMFPLERRQHGIDVAVAFGKHILRAEQHEIAGACTQGHVPRAAMVEVLAVDDDEPHLGMAVHQFPRVVVGGGIHDDDLIGRPALMLQTGQQLVNHRSRVQRGNNDWTLV